MQMIKKILHKVPIVLRFMLPWLLMVLAITAVSCKSFERTSSKSESKLFKDDLRSLERMDSIVKNREIIDGFKIPLPQANTGDSQRDKELNRELIGLVKRLSTSKTSGGNSYDLRYDEKLQKLILDVYIQGTQDRKFLEKKQDSTTTTTDTVQEDNSDTKVYVWPWWVYALIIGAGAYIVLRVVMISSPLVKTIYNLAFAKAAQNKTL